MITAQEKLIKINQGYDIGFEKNGKKYWINSSTWNEEKEEKLFQETGLKSFRENTGNRNLVLYDPEYFVIPASFTEHTGVTEKCYFLAYQNKAQTNIPQPINMSSACHMFEDAMYIEYLDLSDWDMTNVKNMSNMFTNCQSLEELNLSGWSISGFKTIDSIFGWCYNLTTLNLSGWDVSDADYDYVFQCCESLFKKYNTEDDEELFQKIIEDSNKNLKHLQAF